MKKNKAGEDLNHDIEMEDESIIENIEETIEVIEEKVSTELESVKKINGELIDKLQRSLAEFDNFRKRTIKEKSNMYNDGVRDTVEKLIPVIDNFERALSTFENKEDATYKGVEMICRQFNSFLEELGVEQVKAVGEKFDTAVHYAVAHVTDENYSENEVIQELQKGYKYKDKVIRCSMVRVAN
jgi:molecular chaperone GrpE